MAITNKARHIQHQRLGEHYAVEPKRIAALRKKDGRSFDEFWQYLYGTDADPTTGLWWRLGGQHWGGMSCLEQLYRRSYEMHECVRCGCTDAPFASKSILIASVPVIFYCAECEP